MAEDNPESPVPMAPYSPALLRLYVKVQQAKTREERSCLMAALAALFFREHDITDAVLNDGYHDYFEEYDRTRLKFQQAAVRLARLAVHEIDESGVTVEGAAAAATEKSRELN